MGVTEEEADRFVRETEIAAFKRELQADGLTHRQAEKLISQMPPDEPAGRFIGHYRAARDLPSREEAERQMEQAKAATRSTWEIKLDKPLNLMRATEQEHEDFWDAQLKAKAAEMSRDPQRIKLQDRQQDQEPEQSQ